MISYLMAFSRILFQFINECDISLYFVSCLVFGCILRMICSLIKST